MKNIPIIISLAGMLCFASCQHHEEEKHEASEYLVTTPLRKDTFITKEFVCQIRAISHIELRSQERGYLQEIFIDEGEFVKKGQPLFQIMPKLYDAELQKSKAEANLAEIEYKNTKALADSNIVSPNELSMAKAKFDMANAEMALSQVHLDFTKIRAPFDGIIDRFQVRLGSLLDEGDLLTNLSDNSQMWVYFNVPEAEYLDYKLEMASNFNNSVSLLMANNKVFDMLGNVETIEADFNNETGNIPFRATFPNPNGLLRHGETGSILMTIPLKNVLIIPQKTTYEVLDKKYVFVVDKDNVLQTRQINIAQELPHLYVVESGLEENDKILLEGLRKVRAKEKIDIEYVKPQVALSQLELYAE